MAVLSPKGDGGCEIKAAVTLTVDGQPMESGSKSTSYAPAKVKITAENGGAVTLVINDLESVPEV